MSDGFSTNHCQVFFTSGNQCCGVRPVPVCSANAGEASLLCFAIDAARAFRWKWKRDLTGSLTREGVDVVASERTDQSVHHTNLAIAAVYA